MGAGDSAPWWRPAAVLMIALGASIAGGPAAAQDDAQYRRVFDQLLQDPANPELNLRYAKLAIDRNELERARAA